MHCSVDPFRKSTEHRPTRTSESPTKLFSHREAMIRGGTRAHHGNGFTGAQMPEQRSIPMDVQPGRR